MRPLTSLCLFFALAGPLFATPPAIHFQAHRGGLDEVPENTMAAFYHAWRLGGIPEIDLRTTSDGVFICLHDETLKRTSNATDESEIPVKQMSLASVQRYDAGTRFDPIYAGERVPTLAQVFEVLKRHPDYQIYLDLKDADLPTLSTHIESYGVAGQIIFCHNKIASCKAMKMAIPGLRTMLWMGGDADSIWAQFQQALENRFAHLDQIQLHLRPVANGAWPYELSQERVAEALLQCKEAGIDLEVLPFEFNCDTLRNLIEMGVQWYATDAPQRFTQCLEEVDTTPIFLNNGVTAHRGDSGFAPENTMAAIEAALSLGADWIEIDVFKTADGHIVVTHDADTERVALQSLAVEDSTLGELQRLDVAADFRKTKGLDNEHCPPAMMPTLRQVIARIQLQHRTRLSIQPKSDVVDEAIALIRELKAETWVGFNDGDLKKMSRVKELAPEIPVFWDRFKESPLATDLETAKGLGFESMVPHVGALTPDVVTKLKAEGVEVGGWTVNDEKTMQYLLDIGVDRIYTDYPDRLLGLK